MGAIRRFCATAGLLALALPARAITLPVEIEYTFELANTPPITITSVGLATVNGSGAGGHLHSLALASGQIAGSALVPVTDPGAAPITGVFLSLANGAGAVSETGGGTLGGSIPTNGFAKTCLFGTAAPCAAAVSNITVPLTPVGAGGFGVETGALNLTVIGVPWTTATVAIGASSVPALTRMGFAHGPVSGTSSTAQPGGVLSLVTPIYVTSNQGIDPVIPAFARMTLRFVPEPATLTLLGGAIAGLTIAGRRRREPPAR